MERPPLINKMPGEYDQKFSNLRAMYAYMDDGPPWQKAQLYGQRICPVH